MARTENYWKKTKLIEEAPIGLNQEYSHSGDVKRIDIEKEKILMNGVDFTPKRCKNEK